MSPITTTLAIVVPVDEEVPKEELMTWAFAKLLVYRNTLDQEVEEFTSLKKVGILQIRNLQEKKGKARQINEKKIFLQDFTCLICIKKYFQLCLYDIFRDCVAN